MYQRQGPKAFKKDLTNIIALCALIGNPHKDFKSVHIAGTNGKGTVTHMVACGLMAQGYKVGIYTSPHYKDFRERIKVNGNYISKRRVVQYLNEFLSHLELLRPSFFELTVGMAFKFFADENVDIAVIETGLGGRLDSTNIITPELSVITNISFDHTAFLGNTLELIAGEKAGIIKSGVPVLIGEYQQEVAHVFKNKANILNSKLYFGKELVRLESKSVFIEDNEVLNDLMIDVDGPFLNNNLTTSFSALEILRRLGWKIDWRNVEHSFRTCSYDLKFIGRWQWLGRKPDILADSAHNIGGLSVILEKIKRLDYKKIHFVLGFVNDKDLRSVLNLFPCEGEYYFAKANIPRGLDADLLRDAAASFGLKGKSYSSVRRALSAARSKCRDNELIYVGGSIFTVAEIV